MLPAHVPGYFCPASFDRFATDIGAYAVWTLAKLVILNAAASVFSLVLPAHNVGFGRSMRSRFSCVELPGSLRQFH